MKVAKSELKPKMLKFFRQIEKTGEELIVTDHGKPVLRIVPFIEDSDKCFDELKGTVIKFVNPTEPVGLNDWDLLE